MGLIDALVYKLWSWMNSHKTAYAAHIANVSAHHTKYTNADAIAAVLADDKYVKNYDGDKIVLPSINKQLLIERLSSAGGSAYALLVNAHAKQLQVLESSVAAGDAFFRIGNGTNIVGYYMPLFWLKSKPRASAYYGAGFVIDTTYTSATQTICSFMVRKNNSVIPSGTNILFDFTNYYAAGGGHRILAIRANDNIDFLDHKLANPKNHAHSALSGTKKLVEIDIGGSPYYYEVYPTKA